MKVVVRPLSELKSNPRNARTHSQRQTRQIANSIEAFGFNNPQGEPVSAQASRIKIKPGTLLLREWHGSTHEVM